MTHSTSNELETRQVGFEFASRLAAGDVVLFMGELGAGKTTMIRGLLGGLGYAGAVRSPTFNLIQTFDTDPPVMHADLYRVKSYAGIGIEDYLATHLCLIEWPDRLAGLLDFSTCWRVRIEFDGEGREIEIEGPSGG